MEDSTKEMYQKAIESLVDAVKKEQGLLLCRDEGDGQQITIVNMDTFDVAVMIHNLMNDHEEVGMILETFKKKDKDGHAKH